MKKLALIFSMMLIVYSGFSQIENKQYSISKYILIANNDSLVYYSRDSLENIWDLNRITYYFNPNNTYAGVSVNNINKSGTWEVNNNNLIIDNDTSEIVNINFYKITLKNRFFFKNENILYQGTLLTELINYVYSLKSGSWNDISTWSCNCLPNQNDNVLIKNGHRIGLTNSMGIQKCNNLIVEKGGFFENSGNLSIHKP